MKNEILGIGIYEKGCYTRARGRTPDKAYIIWVQMLKNIKNGNEIKNKDWLEFQKFASWFYNERK